MSQLWRKIKRANKKAAKYRYTISCKELIIDCEQKWRPESIIVAWMHRKRRYEIDPRRLEWSFDNPNRAMVMWPESLQEPLNLTTTLFRDQEQDQYEDKEWTLIIEAVTPKGKRKPLAAVPINLRLFVTDLPGSKMEAKFKLRPLRREILGCTVQFDISSKLVREAEVIDNDRHSIASALSIPEDRVSIPVNNDALDSKQIESIEPERFAKEVAEISNDIQYLNKVARNEPVATDANQSISSVSAVPQFTYDITKISNEIHSFDTPTSHKIKPVTETDHAKETTPKTSLTGDASPKLHRKRYTSGQDANGTSNEPVPIDLSHGDQINSLVDDIKSLRFNKQPGKVNENEANKKLENYRQEARRLLQNPDAVIVNTNLDDERRKQLEEELRKMKAHTATPPVLSSNNDLPPIQPLRRTASARANSNTDLRTLDVITTQTNFRPFKKLEPSPQLQRKNYDNPILPAYGRVSNGSTDHLYNNSPSTSTPIALAFNRVKQYSSMKGQELAEHFAQIVSPGLEFVDKKQQVNIRQNNAQQHPTPTRKLISRLDKDLRNSTDPSLELQKITERIEEIERESVDLVDKIQNVMHGSTEEEDLLIRRVELTNEKDALVRRQDYFNVLADLNETKEKVDLVKNQIAGNDAFAKTEADKQKIDNLMSQLKDLIDRQEELTRELDNKIEEEEQERERSRQTLERTRNFNRPQQEPLSASKRTLINLFRP